MSGRGRGRGRGNTLPAWVTNNQNGGAEQHYQGQRSQQGLGYSNNNSNHSRLHDVDSWERDGGRGDIMNPRNNFVREEASSLGMGRGRGRGRGRGINNRPAWMNNTDNNGPSGQPNNVNDEEMDSLLAQARQKRQQQQKQSSSQTQSSMSNKDDIKSSNTDVDAASKKLKSKEEKEQEKLEKQRKLEEEAKEAARKMEEEAKRLEQLKEEEEQRQLRALVGDFSDNEEDQSMMTDENDKKRNHQDDNDGDDDGLFQFETEEEREERQARKRREERRRKLRKLEETNEVKQEDVDMPRNVAGVIKSEKLPESINNDVSIKMEVDANYDVNEEKKQDEENSDDDSFDMFATTDNATPVPTQNAKNATSSKNDTNATAQECDDAEGYYKANIGEIITLPKETAEDVARFRVLGIIGKGVFASVIKCVEDNANGTQQDIASPRVVAMKVIRNNEVMARAAAKEMRILRMLCSRSRTKGKVKNSKKDLDDNDDEFDKEEQQRLELENHNIVRLLEVDGTSSSHGSLGNGDSKAFSAPPPEFRSHCIFLFEYLPHNLREVLNKFGKNVGINLTAVKSYARQLLCALRHLEKHRIVHSDIKPDNILVSANFSTLKLCDFGSAFFETDHDNDPTPYLVSRFYRPPEVILGLEYDRMVDLWSVGVTISELYTGSVLFPGSSNNDMLKKFMDTMGPFSFKMVRRHNASYEKMGLQPHFEIGNTGGTYEFRKQDLDKVTGQPIVRIVNVLTGKTEASLAQVLLKSSKVGVSERVEVLKLANFLNRCLQLDPARRIGVRDALMHEFFQKKKKKEESA